MKMKWKTGFFVPVMALILLLTACGGNNSDVSISISPATAQMDLGKSVSLNVNARNSNFTLSAPAGAGCVESGNVVTCTPTTAGVYDIKVTATADTSKDATARITVNIPPFEADMLTLTPGGTTNEIGVTWHGAIEDGMNGRVRYAPKSVMTGNDFPAGAVTVDAASVDAYTGRVSHKATLTGLLPNTEYVYAVSNDGVDFSKRYTYRTPAAGAFSFVTVGDPQLTDPSVTPPDTEAVPPTPGGYMEKNHSKTTRQGWQETINSILRVVPDVGFIAGVGDQVDRNLIGGGPESRFDEHEPKYANFLAPDALRSLPYAPAVGNHEARSNYSFLHHYNLPNETIIPESEWVVTSESAGRHVSQRTNENRNHYYYRYNNALFVVLNSSARVSSPAQAAAMIDVFGDVLSTATTTHAGQYDWLFVHHHKTTAGLADHAADVDIQLYVEAGFELLMLEYGVDVVFAGHDHIYARSFPVQASNAAGSINGVVFDRSRTGDINQGDGTVFFTLNSSSGQKFYEEFVPDITNNANYPYLVDGTKGSAGLMEGILPWAVNVYHQEYKPMFMGIDVTDTSVTITAYEVQDDGTTEVIDTFTITKTININILHTNDVHGRLYQVDGNNAGMMGIDKVAAIKNRTRNVVLVDAGDTIHGLPIVNINQGLNAIELMAAAGYRVMTPGNHDFNYGSARLSELAGIASIGGLDIISSNVFNTTNGQSLLPTNKIVEIGGVKVGFFGLTTLETPILTGPAGVATLDFRAYKQSAESAIAELRKNGAQVIVALAHVNRDDIVALVSELTDKPDVVIEGHDHTRGSITTVHGVLIASAGQYQENIGKVSITIDLSGEIIGKSASLITRAQADGITGDATVKTLAETRKAEVADLYSEVVARSEVLLSSDRGTDAGAPGVRNTEQPLGNLVADAMRIIGAADVAITNGGGLRADIRIGDITKGDINSILPFGNVLVIKEATPRAIREIMETGLSSLPATHGRFPQISGMNVVYDLTKPAGQRVVSITINSVVLDLNNDTTVYKLATNDFMASGGDGYTVMGTLRTLAELDSLDDMLIDYIVNNLGGTITAADAKIEGRLIDNTLAAMVIETWLEQAIVAGSLLVRPIKSSWIRL